MRLVFEPKTDLPILIKNKLVTKYHEAVRRPDNLQGTAIKAAWLALH